MPYNSNSGGPWGGGGGNRGDDDQNKGSARQIVARSLCLISMN